MLEVVSFIVGASVMILELAGVRVATPLLGSNFIIWTSTIGIIMTALSIGYYIGGKLSDKSTSASKLSLIISIAALYTLFTATTQFPFIRFFVYQTNTNIYVTSVIVALYLFAIPSISLGIVSPYIIKLAISQRKITEENTGKLIGKFYAISTLGSIFGTFLCGFFLVAFFGLESISFAISGFIFLAAILCLLSDKNLKKKFFNTIITFNIIFLLLCILFAFFPKIFKNPITKIFKSSFYSKTTPYQYLALIDFDNDERAIANNKTSILSLYNKNKNPLEGLRTYNNLFMSIFLNKEQKDNILILGNSVGILTRAIVYYANENRLDNLKIDTVEIDKDVVEIGKKYFNFEEDEKIKIYYEDARTFLNKMSINPQKKYDLMFWDLYSTDLIQGHLITSNAFENMKAILDKSGILVLNVYSSENGVYKEFLNQVYTNLNAVFPNIKVYAYRENNSSYFAGVVLAYEEETENIKQINSLLSKMEYTNLKIKPIVYTDNYAPVERLYFGL